MPRHESHGPDDTERLGVELGRQAKPGWVYGLTGDLGAGKTRFVRGFARGLGITGRVQSPTFGLVHEHREDGCTLYHLDLYRLESTEQILAAGLEEYFAPRDGVTVVEWFERWGGPAPPRLCRLVFESTGETRRRIEYDFHPEPRPGSLST